MSLKGFGPSLIKPEKNDSQIFLVAEFLSQSGLIIMTRVGKTLTSDLLGRRLHCCRRTHQVYMVWGSPAHHCANKIFIDLKKHEICYEDLNYDFYRLEY